MGSHGAAVPPGGLGLQDRPDAQGRPGGAGGAAGRAPGLVGPGLRRRDPSSALLPRSAADGRPSYRLVHPSGIAPGAHPRIGVEGVRAGRPGAAAVASRPMHHRSLLAPLAAGLVRSALPACGVAAGGGQRSSTTPDADGGHLYARAAAYGASGGQELCR